MLDQIGCWEGHAAKPSCAPAKEPEDASFEREFDAHEPLPICEPNSAAQEDPNGLADMESWYEPSPTGSPEAGPVQPEVGGVLDRMAERAEVDLPEAPEISEEKGASEPHASEKPDKRERSKHPNTHNWGAFLLTYKIQGAGAKKEQRAWQATFQT